MRKRFRTVKSQLTLIMVLFGALVAVLITIFGMYLTYGFQRRIAVQSTEFNLQLVAGMIEQDIRDLSSLGKWCGSNSNVTDYFLRRSGNQKWQSLQAYYRITEELANNRAGKYAWRLIIVNESAEKILQSGSFDSSSEPLTMYNVAKLGDFDAALWSEWEEIVRDPLYRATNADIIPLVSPVYHPSDRSRIGTVFMAVSTAVITDKLSSYSLPQNAELYLTLGGNHYKITDDSRFLPVSMEYEQVGPALDDPISDRTTAIEIRDGGGRHMLVSYPVCDGVALTQLLAQEQFLFTGNVYGSLVGGLFFLILLLSVVVILLMDRIVSRPVTSLRKKVEAMSLGDFSSDAGIEWDNELGDVGKGINDLSRNIVSLMDRRVDDEKKSRDLEYRMLQSQINPHFLYNTLGSIKWMATLQNAAGIAEMTTALSRMLGTIAKDLRKLVPLEDELALLDDYLLIQKYRYGDNVSLTVKVDDDLLRTPIPRFSLQPLVENAIFHGIEPKGTGRIIITAERGEGCVLVTITDDGVGISTEALRHITGRTESTSGVFSKLGWRNVDERLRYAFGEHFGLSVESEVGKYTSIVMRLPAEAETLYETDEKEEGEW